MDLIFQTKLVPTPEQRRKLLATMEQVNGACNAIAKTAFDNRIASKFALQKRVYSGIRERFGLSAQLTIRAIAKVAAAYKRDKKIQPAFRSQGAIDYDQRILSWKGPTQVSILTLDGRETISVTRPRPTDLRGHAKLVYRGGEFYLLLVRDVAVPEAFVPNDYLGVDLGIVNIAADSDGEMFSGGRLNGLRKRHTKLRQRLQRIGTQSAKRLLKKRRRKEAYFARDVNHVISKKLVAKAKDTGRGIALEDLKGIRERITVRKAQRRVQNSWAFGQLRNFVSYKGQLAGVLVVLVDPRNTSRTCPQPRCGHISKANRPTQAIFKCVRCGFTGPADTVAAENIRRVAINRPNVGDGLQQLSTYKPPALAGGR